MAQGSLAFKIGYIIGRILTRIGISVLVIWILKRVFALGRNKSAKY